MRFTAQTLSLPKILEFIRERLTSLDESSKMKFELACEEAIVNVINHAYKGTVGEIELAFENAPNERLSVVIKDFGPPFDPLKHRVKPQAPLEEMEEGGLGIHLILNCVDRVEYQRKEGANVLTLTHFFQKK
jgi:anti-sigma regulatory factor (Ser/Thr protein kinase)